jgi:hypothetical protein
VGASSPVKYDWSIRMIIRMDQEYILLVRVIVPPLHNGCCSGKHEMTTSRITMNDPDSHLYFCSREQHILAYRSVITAGNNNNILNVTVNAFTADN